MCERSHKGRVARSWDVRFLSESKCKRVDCTELLVGQVTWPHELDRALRLGACAHQEHRFDDRNGAVAAFIVDEQDLLLISVFTNERNELDELTLVGETALRYLHPEEVQMQVVRDAALEL